MMTELLREFKQRFQIFVKLKTDFQVFCSPFTINPSDLPVDLQLKIIDLQFDSTLKTKKFVLASLGTFYQRLFPGYQWRSQPKNFGEPKCLILGEKRYFLWKKRFSKHKMTICSKNFGVSWPVLPPCLRLCRLPQSDILATKVLCMFGTTSL